MRFKKLLIILATIFFYNSFVTVALSSRVVTPDRGDEAIIETIEELIETNQESSQRMEELTGEIKLLNEKLVRYTVWLIVLTVILSMLAIIDFIRLIRSKDKQDFIVKQSQRVYVGRRFRKKRFLSCSTLSK